MKTTRAIWFQAESRVSNTADLPQNQRASCIELAFVDQEIGRFETLASGPSRINTQVSK